MWVREALNESYGHAITIVMHGRDVMDGGDLPRGRYMRCEATELSPSQRSATLYRGAASAGPALLPVAPLTDKPRTTCQTKLLGSLKLVAAWCMERRRNEAPLFEELCRSFEADIETIVEDVSRVKNELGLGKNQGVIARVALERTGRLQYLHELSFLREYLPEVAVKAWTRKSSLVRVRCSLRSVGRSVGRA